ncbi:MAG: amino acid-binding protein, partial [Clostridiaceae bacterium]|nr:amino acid-binding protein [Clostridiaceae bacterium]
MAKQLSVFLENRRGRMRQVASLLKSADINILSFNLAETTDYGMLRLMVDDPEEGAAALAAGGFSAHLTDVMVVYLPAR